jgi:PAS domain S-box-containing protein
MIETAMREGFHFFEWTHRRLDGEVFTADVLLTRMDLAGQTVLQATVRDITERQQSLLRRSVGESRTLSVTATRP